MRLAAVIFVVLTGVVFVCAQDRLQQAFERLDADEDGRISREEAGGRDWFGRFDTDGDGFVTLAEARAGAERRNERPGRPVADVVTDVPASPPDAIFQLAWVHAQPTAQATALLDLTGNGALGLTIAAKPQLHIITNDGADGYAHAATHRVDRVNGWGAHDFNADGRLDLFLAQPEGEIADSWLNNGDGTFTQMDLGNETVGTTRNVVFADFDRDGLVDSYHSVSAFGTNHRGSELHPGVAGGRFGPDIIDDVLDPPVPDFWYTMVTTPEGRQERWANKQFKGAVVRDFDGDGLPDLVTTAYADRGFQDPRFKGFAMRFVDEQARGVFLLHNRSTPGEIRFAEVSREALGEDTWGNSSEDWNVYAPVPIDYDRDGDFDLFVGAHMRPIGRGETEDTDIVRLYENVSTPGQMQFIERTEEAGLQQFNDLAAPIRAQINFASGAPVDYDNDGFVDLVLVNRRDMESTNFSHLFVFRNTGDGAFVEIPPEAHGLGSGAGGRDLCCGDLNGDGLVDVVVNDGTVGGYEGMNNTRIYHNRAAADNHWLKVRVVEDDGGVMAFGATVRIYESGTDRLLGIDEVRTDFCYRSKRSPVLHFGLGEHETVDLRVADGEREVLAEGVPADGEITVELSTGEAEPARDVGPRTGAVPEGVTKHADIAWAQMEGVEPERLSLDLYAPDDVEDAPIMLYVHGGGWAKGDKSAVWRKPELFCGSGWLFASTNYRFVPQVTPAEQVRDVARAIAWLDDHAAEYGGDPKQIYLMGHSAGAHLVALVSTWPEPLQEAGLSLSALSGAVIVDTATLDLETHMKAHMEYFGEGGLFCDAFGTDPAFWKQVAPLTYVAPDTGIPPVLVLMQGTEARFGHGQRFADALVASGINATVIHLAQHDHGSINASIGVPGDPTTEAIAGFLAGTGADLGER